MKYKLIQSYPGSPNLGDVLESPNYSMESYPDFWAKFIGMSDDEEELFEGDGVYKINKKTLANVFLSLDKLDTENYYYFKHVQHARNFLDIEDKKNLEKQKKESKELIKEQFSKLSEELNKKDFTKKELHYLDFLGLDHTKLNKEEIALFKLLFKDV